MLYQLVENFGFINYEINPHHRFELCHVRRKSSKFIIFVLVILLTLYKVFKLNMEVIKECIYHGLTEHSKQKSGKFKCKKCTVEATQKRRDKVKVLSVDYKGGKCEICGYNKCIDALEFHHIDPNEKEFGISSKGYTRSWEKIKNEIDKCNLLCSNCHKELHDKGKTKLYTLDNLSTDRNTMKEEIEKLKISPKIKIKPNRNELKDLIRTIPFTEIGKIYGVVDNSIRKWCKNFNLPSKKEDIKKNI